MKKLFINIVLLFGLVLFAQDGVKSTGIADITINNNITNKIKENIIEDINDTIKDDNITVEDINDTVTDDNTTEEDEEDTNSTTKYDNVVTTIIQIKPIISFTNINAKKEEIIVAGQATKSLVVEVIFIHNTNERIVVTTSSDEHGQWSISRAKISKQLDDGAYDIFVSTKDRYENKSEISSKKDLVRDTSINGSVIIKDGSSQVLSDNIINIKELNSFYIAGDLDLDCNINELSIYNEKDPESKIFISDYKLIKNSERFEFNIKNIDLNKLQDGQLTVVMSIQDEHNNTLVQKSTISKDTIAPTVPFVTDVVKNHNMIYGKVPNLLVFGGNAEVDSTIEAILFNTRYPKLKTKGTIKTPASTKWTLAGKDFAIADLKDGQIKSSLVQIDKAGNRSEPLVIILNKERPLIFPEKTVLIPPENYIPIFTIKDISDKVKSIVVSDNYIIAGSFEFIYYFDKAKGKLQKQFEIKNQWVNSMIIQDHKLILGLESGDIQIRDLDTGRLLKTLKTHKMPILYLTIDKTTNHLVSSSSNGNIIIWDLKDYTKLHTLKKHQWDVSALAVNGDMLYTGSDDYSIKMWDIKSGKLLKSLKSAHGGAINSIVIYKNMLISASDDKMIFVRDLDSGRLLHILKGHKRGVNVLKINHDTLVSASSDRTLILWNLHTFTKIKQLRGHSKSILCLDINNENIVTGAMDYKIRVWGYDESLQGQGDIDETILAKYDLIRSLDISSDIVTSLAQTSSELVFSTKGYIFFYNNITYKFDKSYSTLDKVFGAVKKDGTKSEDTDDEWGDTVDTEDEYSKEKEDDGWETSTDEEEKSGWEEDLAKKIEKRALEAQSSLQWVNDIDIQGTVLTAALGFKNIKIWDLERNKAVKLLEGHESSVLSITRTDGSFITSSSSGSVKVWDDESDALLLSIDAHQWDVRTTVVDDGKLYTGSDDYSIKIWDMETGDLIKTIKTADMGSITKLLIVGNNLISSSQDGTIKYRDKNTGELLKVLSGHTDSINTMINDEEHLISGSDDGTIKVWDLKTGKLVKTLKNGHIKGISALMITDDYIVSGGKDKKISIWKYYE